MARLNNYIDYINENAEDNPKEFIAQCETRYKNIINNITDECIKESNGRFVIMLAGPSASGKTTTAHKLCDSFVSKGVNCDVISLDDFYLNRTEVPGFAEGKPDYESVTALDLTLIEQCLRSLLRGEETYLPEFNFEKGIRDDKAKKLKLNENDAIIVEGLHALNPIVTANIPEKYMTKIYVSVSSRIYDDESEEIILQRRNIRFIRRLVRDYYYRGSSVENTYKLWIGVRESEDKFLFKFKDYADLRINTIHIYEPCIFKDIATEMLRTVPEDSEFYRDAKRLIKALSKFNSIPLEEVPEDSMLREFFKQ